LKRITYLKTTGYQRLKLGKEWRFLKDEVFEAMSGKSTVSMAARSFVNTAIGHVTQNKDVLF